MSWTRRLPRWAVDLAEALGVGAAWFGVIHFALKSYWYPSWLDGYVTAGLWLMAAIALRRVAPTWTFWVTVLVFPFVQTFGMDSYFQLLPLMVAGFAMAQAGKLPVWVVAPVTAISTGALVNAVGNSLPLALQYHTINPFLGLQVRPSEFLVAEFLAVGAVVIGAMFRRLELAGDKLRERNEELHALQDALSQQAVVAERARIARELHDVVAHHVSAIVVRAQAADRVADRQPQAPREAVQWIADEGKQALTAMRAVVHVLRSDDGPERTPTPSATTTCDLVREAAERVRAAGRVVQLAAPQDLGPVSTQTGLALTRIAQEAMTNVLLHSASARVNVTVAAQPHAVLLTVHDDGPATGAPGGGNGLTHMRERAAACGGTVLAGPDGPGWVVHAELPRGT